MAQAAIQGVRNALGFVASPFVKFGYAYAAAAEKRPFTVGVLTTGIKTSAADLFAQMVLEKRQFHEIDGKRHFTFCLFGFTYLVRTVPSILPQSYGKEFWHLASTISAYSLINEIEQGAFQYFFYTKVLVWATNPITRTMGHIASSPAKTFVDQAFHHPFMYFPTFYLMKYSLVGGEPVEVAIERYSDELWPNCNALWKLWVPCQLVNFAVVPVHLQIPYCAAVSFVWTIILSMMRGSDTGAVEDKQTTSITQNADSPSATDGVAAVKEAGSRSASAAATPENTPARAGFEEASEGSVASGTGVPIGGILAVASQSAEQSDQAESATPTSPAPPETSASLSEAHLLPPRTPRIENLTAAAAATDIAAGFAGHAHASIAPAPPLEHQSPAIPAAASMSEHSNSPSAAGPSGPAAASIVEPLVCLTLCPHAPVNPTATTTEGTGDGSVGMLGFAMMSIDRLGGCSKALSKDVAGLWAGAAGLLHLQHPLEVSS